jgi:formylglycine-generating enzyme required for sulfatase activity
MGDNPSNFKDDPANPVEQVSWRDITENFLSALNRLVPGLEALLPTEAQWENACRAGTTTPFSFGKQITPAQVNYDGDNPYAGGEKGEYREKTVPVKSLRANGWGLHEMHGNVWEWVEDCYKASYEGAPTDGSAAKGESCKLRVLRGGSWNYNPTALRAAYRYATFPELRANMAGFRVARSL